MKKLPQTFELDKYGLHVRLVNESDASFIIDLRTNERLSKYIHDTSNDLNKQIEWIRQYKQREAVGKEYYFIYYKNGNPFAVNRLYNIHDKVFTGGSWVCLPDHDVSDIVATTLIQAHIAFNLLGMELNDCFDGIHENNTKVLKFNKMIGLKVTGMIDDVKGKYYVGTITKDDFLKCQKKLEKLLNI